MPFSSGLSSLAPALTQMPKRHGFDMGHGVGQHVQPIGQAGNLNTHNSIPFQAFLMRQDKIPDRRGAVWQYSETFLGIEQVG